VYNFAAKLHYFVEIQCYLMTCHRNVIFRIFESMNFEAKKLDLINWLTSLKDDAVISQLYAIKNDSDTDWYEQLSSEQKNQIQEGLEDLKKGRTISHEEVMLEMKQKTEQLKK
jgi:predicted transcriptional regulator